MADIFSVEPPRWLQDLTHSNEKGLLGGIAGELLGGGLIAATKATSPDERKNWLQELPQSIGEAHLNFLDPTWKLKVQQGQLNLAHTALGMQEMQQRMNVNATNMQLRAQDLQEIPKWLAEHPTYESRASAEWPVARTPEWNRNLDQIRLRDSQSVQSKVTSEGIKEFSKRVDALSKLDPTGAAQFAPQIGRIPSPEILQALSLAEQTAAVKQENIRSQAEAEAKARGEVPETKITEKGVIKTFKPGTGAKDIQPKETTLSDGTRIIYNPNTGAFKMTTPKGEEKPMTSGQLLAIAKGLSETTAVNPNVKKILDLLGEKAARQVEGAPKTSKESGAAKPAPARTVSELPTKKELLVKGQSYMTSKGVAVWEGDQFRLISK
jgi:hypothetical protein